MRRMARRQGHDSDSEEEEGEPCAPHIVDAPLPQGFKMPTIVPYDGSSDPADHLSKFNRLMSVHRVSEDAKCHVFPITLTGAADEWFKKHRPGSIHSWHQLSSSFRRQFIAARKISFEVNALANIKQGPFETLKAYLKRFKDEAARTKRVDDGQQLMALQAGIRAGSPLWDDLQRRGCHRLDDFIRRAQEYINWEEAQIGVFGSPVAYPTPAVHPPAPMGQTSLSVGGSVQNAPQPSGFTIPSAGYGLPHAGMAPTGHSAFQPVFGAGRNDNPQPSSKRTTNNSRRGSRSKNCQNKPPSATGGRGTQDDRYVPQYSEYTELVDTRENIFVATEQQVHYRRPQPLRRDRAQRDPTKFCRFHNDVGHHTNECRHLKDEIENLIKLGHLHQ